MNGICVDPVNGPPPVGTPPLATSANWKNPPSNLLVVPKYPAVAPAWRFQPFTLSSEISRPNCMPAKSVLTFSAQFATAVATVAPVPAFVAVMFVLLLLFTLTSPPTPRTHMPPPCWSGPGLAGAPTNDELCSRNAVLDAVMEAPSVLPTAAADAPMVPKLGTPPISPLGQFCFCAPGAAHNVAAIAIPVKSQPRRLAPCRPAADSLDSIDACSMAMLRKMILSIAAPVVACPCLWRHCG